MRRVATMGAALAAGIIGGIGIRRLRRRRATVEPSVRGDEVVAAAVRQRLRSGLGSKAEDVAIRVRDGRVTVRGEVETLDEIRRLEGEIGAVDGVEGVNNLLRLDIRRTVRPGEESTWGMWVS